MAKLIERDCNLMATAQHCLLEAVDVEDSDYLKQQLITYIGNKRALLPFIEAGLLQVKRELRT